MRRLLSIFFLAFSLQLFAQADPETVLSYSMGRYAPFGLRVSAEMPSGFGGYISGRCNTGAFIREAYTIKNGRISDTEWSWTYLGKKRYARAEIFVGMQVPVFRPREMFAARPGKEISVSLWGGGGMLFARYLYQFDRNFKNGVGGPTWIRDLDQGKVGFDLEAGVQARIGQMRYHIGCSGLLMKSETLIVIGIGKVFGAK